MTREDGFKGVLRAALIFPFYGLWDLKPTITSFEVPLCLYPLGGLVLHLFGRLADSRNPFNRDFVIVCAV